MGKKVSKSKIAKQIDKMNENSNATTNKLPKDDLGIEYIKLIDKPLPYIVGRGNSHLKFNKYIKPRLDDIIILVQNGFSQATIGRMLGLGVTSFENMIRDEPELKEAFHIGKELLYDKLETTLYNTALGNIKLKTVKKTVNSAGKQSIEETVKDVAPDTGSLIFVLKNKRGDVWRDVRMLDLDSSDTFVTEMDKLSKQIKSIKMSDTMDLVNDITSDVIYEKNEDKED